MKKKIVITNAYTWYNKGDAGILLGTINTLKQIHGEKNVEFTILSFTPDEDKKRYCKDKSIKNVYSNVLNPHPYKHTKLGKIIAIIKLIIKYIYLYMMSNLNLKHLIKKYDNFKELNECDYIVVCGGGFLGGKKLDSLMHVFQMYINTKFNKNIYVMGTSIEPMKNKIVKYFTNNVLKKMTHIFARETITYEYLKSVVSNDKITLIPDMAFMLEDKSEKSKYVSDLRCDSDKIYGITVRKWNFPNYNNPVKLMENYMNSLAEFMNKEIEQNKSAFIFIPQVIVSHGDDSEIAIEIRNRMKEKNRNKFLILHDDISPIEIKSLISNLDFFIGTRMHSNIFATSMGVPTIAIAYEKKTNGIMHTVGLDDYVIEMDEITESKLEELVKIQRRNNQNIRNDLRERIIKLREEIIIKMENVLKNEVK